MLSRRKEAAMGISFIAGMLKMRILEEKFSARDASVQEGTSSNVSAYMPSWASDQNIREVRVSLKGMY
jgi:hypothetical protein